MYPIEIVALLLVLCGAALGNPLERAEKATTPCYSNAFEGYFQTGFYYTFKAYVADLSDIGFNDAICSVEQTGMWIYYENRQYNDVFSGQVYWVHGVGIAVNFPAEACGLTSSLKYAGNWYTLNEDSYTLYSGEFYTGNEFYGNIDSADLTVVSGDTSSLILTGLSPWTFYTGYGYTGYAFCFYPSTDVDYGVDGTVLNFGFYPSLASIGVPDNAFYSAQKGCYTANVIAAPQMKAEERFKNGAWGVFKL